MDRSPSAERKRPLDTIVEKIRTGAAIPIVSNSFRNDRIFAGLGTETALAKPGVKGRRLSIGEQLAKRWAAQIGYPMWDGQDLARVAQFNAV